MLLIYSIQSIALGVLYISLAIMVLVIAYRKLLRYLGKHAVLKVDYAELHPIELQPVSGVVDFYYVVNNNRQIRLELMDENKQVIQVIDDREATTGGNIIRFDSTAVPNGNYYYQLVSDNQKTWKKLQIKNPS